MNIFSCPALAAGLSQAAAKSAVKNADLLASPLFGGVTVVFFFFLAAMFLRFLYGPKGKMREKGWEDLNREFSSGEKEKISRQSAPDRLSALQKNLEPVLLQEGGLFRAYVEAFYTGEEKRDELFRLKDEHSHGVFKNAWRIIQGEPELQTAHAARAAMLAALYHDLGRFEQLRVYRSFNDKESVNHAALGAKILADRRYLAGETPEMKRLVRAAVALHNKAELPARLKARPEQVLSLAARVVRDADKLDILRVMREALRPGADGDPAISFGLPDEAGKYNPEIAGGVIGGKTIQHSAMRSRNDFRLYVCGWSNNFEFRTSLRLAARSGHLDAILAWLPEDALMDEVRAAVKSRLAAGF